MLVLVAAHEALPVTVGGGNDDRRAPLHALADVDLEQEEDHV